MGDADFPVEVITALRTGEPRWVGDEPADAAPTPSLDDDVLDEWPVPPCVQCGSLELWQNVLGDWNCSKCDPPTASRRLLRAVERVRRQYPEAVQAVLTGKPAPGAVCPCGSAIWRDVPIHGGSAVRRDCDRCGRFLNFPVWDGATCGNVTKSQQDCISFGTGSLGLDC